jgi:uncharacterized membrane protein
MSNTLMFLGAFLAATVEMVEALTIVLAVGTTRGWRAALIGVAAGVVALAIVVGALGPSLVTYVPLDALRVVIGTLLLVFGLQWLRKAILRSSGLKAMHDEAAIYEREVSELRGERHGAGLDWVAFTVSFKGVFLEGLEVAFIVLTFGTNDGRFDIPVAGAVAGLVLVVGTGLLVHRPLSQVPENTIKWVVGVMLGAFGTFWVGEGAGISWTLDDGAILALACFYAVVGFALVRILRSHQATAAGQTVGEATV